MAKYCGKCGSRLNENNGLCPHCNADELKALKKADKKAKKRAKRDAMTSGRKVKRFLLKLIAILLMLAVLLAGLVGVLVYFDLVDIPVIDKLMKDNLIKQEDSVVRSIPDTNTDSFILYSSSEDNIVTDRNTGITYVNNELLVTLDSSDSKNLLEDYIKGIDGSIVGEIPELADYQVLFLNEYSAAELENIALELEAQSWVESVSLNYGFKIDAQYTPDDEEWKNQWEDIAGGTNWGVEAIDMPEAWEYNDNMQTTVNIGIIDNMFDINHEDLVFTETPLGNSIVMQDISDDKIEWDDHGTHTAGTIAATFNNKRGIAGISTNNCLYGVSYKGLSSGGYGTLQTMKISLYYLIAANNCSVINMSIGVDHLTFEASREGKVAIEELTALSGGIENLLKRLIDDGHQFVICKSAGNQNEVGGGYRYFRKDNDDDEYSYEYYAYSDYLRYLNGEEGLDKFERYKNEKEAVESRLDSGNVDAEYDFLGMIKNQEVKDRIIIVGAVKNLGSHKEGGFLWFGRTTVHNGYAIAEFSQCGERVDVLAPGVEIYSTTKNNYQNMSGTSMSAPHVSGVAALVLSMYPEISGAQVKEIICDSAVGSYGDEDYGLLNAKNAVEIAADYDTTDMEEPSPERTTSGERDIVLTLDVSGSMAGTPLEETKKASINFIETILNEDASIGVVKYDNAAYMVSDFSVDESVLENIINEMRDGGSTNIEAGLSTASEMFGGLDSKKKIIVLMSDGEPNEGKVGEELIAYADEIKDSGVIIYTLGFFVNMSGSKSSAQILMERIASEGCHYEVSSADDLVFFFEDVADQINGQRYIYVRIACPVDVSVTYNGETLDSSESNLSTRTDFGTLSFEESNESSYGTDDDRIKVLRLKEGVSYDIRIIGNGHGIMDYTVAFMDENGDYSDFRAFEDIKITKRTVISTVAVVSDETILRIDEDGDGKYDITYRAGENGYGVEVKKDIRLYVVVGGGAFVLMILAFVAVKKVYSYKKKKGE